MASRLSSSIMIAVLCGLWGSAQLRRSLLLQAGTHLFSALLGKDISSYYELTRIKRTVKCDMKKASKFLLSVCDAILLGQPYQKVRVRVMCYMTKVNAQCTCKVSFRRRFRIILQKGGLKSRYRHQLTWRNYYEKE